MRIRIPAWLAAIPRDWQHPKTVSAFFLIEVPFTVAALALFGIAAPDLYRTLLWQEGSDHGWNSNPIQILYDYANYRPVHTPLPWSSFVTDFNVVISVLSMFISIVKVVMFICDCWVPLLSFVIHAILAALYAISIHAQAAPDMSDPQHPQPGAPWYITKSCGPPVSARVHGYCQQAKGAFAVTVCLCALFFLHCIFSLISLYPSRARRLARADAESDLDGDRAQKWEMLELSATPGTSGGMKSPVTPRTMAFNTLGGLGGGKKAGGGRVASGWGRRGGCSS
ncbi:MAG: hypothetical protein FRX48_01084 [Lasallia pustulata]|uniref:Uncharacterized protein n=1 Tax=Lasallia pustulata TaxID=136370 RepID=A0A5M8Q291_9LECA|nr:MAG: hypothetical protein FRX48_01084 [Lasallia pustulata]